MSTMLLRVREQPVQHGAERCDPGSRGNENGIAQRRSQGEIAERTLERDLLACAQIAEIVRHETILNAVQTERDVAVGRRR